MKAIVLLSGGQDSTTCLFWAKHALVQQFGIAERIAPGEFRDRPVELHALSVYYGQRHMPELAAARCIGKLAGVESHVEVDLAGLFCGSESALIDHGADLRAEGGRPDAALPQGLPTSFVPGRNALFLAAAAARAGAIGADVIVTGVCQTDYSGYPDCRVSFVNALQAALDLAWPSNEDGESTAPAIVTPLMRLTKAETVQMMVGFAHAEAKADGHEQWTSTPAWRALAQSMTCYHGRRPGCGSCPACILRARGFADCGIEDPEVGRVLARTPEGRAVIDQLTRDPVLASVDPRELNVTAPLTTIDLRGPRETRTIEE